LDLFSGLCLNAAAASAAPLVSRGYARAEEMLKNYYGVWGRDLTPGARKLPQGRAS
jgi:hypothetical protein